MDKTLGRSYQMFRSAHIPPSEDSIAYTHSLVSVIAISADLGETPFALDVA